MFSLFLVISSRQPTNKSFCTEQRKLDFGCLLESSYPRGPQWNNSWLQCFVIRRLGRIFKKRDGYEFHPVILPVRGPCGMDQLLGESERVHI